MFCPFHEITGFSLTLLYKVLRSENSEENSEESCDAGRRTKFAPVKSLDSSEFSSEFSDLKTLSSNVKVNLGIS